MLPRLEAERELASINAMSAAFGGMKRFDRQRYVGRLERAARGGARASVPASPEALAAMGIAVVVVPPAKGTAVSSPGIGPEADRASSAPRPGEDANRFGGPNG